MDRVPILKLEDFLLVSIQVDMHDQLALTLQDDLTQKIVAMRARAVLIDISALEMVDSFMGRMLGNIAATIATLSAGAAVQTLGWSALNLGTLPILTACVAVAAWFIFTVRRQRSAGIA